MIISNSSGYEELTLVQTLAYIKSNITKGKHGCTNFKCSECLKMGQSVQEGESLSSCALRLRTLLMRKLITGTLE